MDSSVKRIVKGITMKTTKTIKTSDDTWKKMVFAFVARNRRLYGMQQIKAPEKMISDEQHAIQRVYEMMREACLKDDEYLKICENVEKVSPPEPPADNENNSLVLV